MDNGTKDKSTSFDVMLCALAILVGVKASDRTAAIHAGTPDVLAHVDPFIGSGGAGFGAGGHNPGAQVPFGIMRLGPDTGTLLGKDEIVEPPFDHYGGYHHSDNSIVAFSHTHMVGAGVGDLGNFGVMCTRFPTSGSESELAKLCTTAGGHAVRSSAFATSHLHLSRISCLPARVLHPLGCYNSQPC